jgi:hypothetical protein
MLGKYTKAIIAIVGALITAFIGLSTDADVVGVNWGDIFTVTAGALTGVLTFLLRNKQTVDAVDVAIEKGDFTVGELKELYEKWNKNR